MSYAIKNTSDLADILSRAIRSEIEKETDFSKDIIDIVVNNYDLEAHGLSQMVKDIMDTIKRVADIN